MDKKLMERIAKIAMDKRVSGQYPFSETTGVQKIKSELIRQRSLRGPKMSDGENMLPPEFGKFTAKIYEKMSPEERIEKLKNVGLDWAKKHNISGRLDEDVAAEYVEAAKKSKGLSHLFQEDDKSTFSKILGNERGSIGPQGSAEKNAESTAPKKRNTMKPNEKPMKSATFSSMERDLPKGGGKTMKIAKQLDPDDAMKATIKKMMPGNKLGKALKRTGIAAMVGGPIGLGVNALMESLDAEEGGSEEERLDEVAMGQEAKTEAKIKADKAKVKSLPASTKKSYPTKEKVKPLPQNVKKTVVETRAPMPMGKSEDEVMEEFNQEGKRNIPDWSPGFADKLKQKIEGIPIENMEESAEEEFKKAAKQINKKPISTYMKR